MTQLLLMMFIGIFLLCFALFLLGRRSGTNSEDCADSELELLKMLRLSSLEFDATTLFSDADYRLLASEPKFHTLAQELRKDRTDIAQEWLRELLHDVFLMWRFRNFLTRLGVAASVRDELLGAVRSVLLMCFVCVVRVSIKLFGLYALGKTVIVMRNSAENLKQYCVTTLEALPRERWPQIATEWQRVQAL